MERMPNALIFGVTGYTGSTLARWLIGRGWSVRGIGRSDTAAADLEDLGVDCIYLTPIFASAANHRYHTYDYFEVDPILGGKPAFIALVETQKILKVLFE